MAPKITFSITRGDEKRQNRGNSEDGRILRDWWGLVTPRRKKLVSEILSPTTIRMEGV